MYAEAVLDQERDVVARLQAQRAEQCAPWFERSSSSR